VVLEVLYSDRLGEMAAAAKKKIGARLAKHNFRQLAN